MWFVAKGGNPMNVEALFSLRATGILLILSILVPLVGVIVISRGDFSGFQASIQGIEGVGESADILRKTFPLASFTVVLVLVANGLLTLLLREAGDNHISLLAFNLLLFSQVFMIFQTTFHSSVTVWAAKELARTGSVPEIFQPLWQWMYTTVQQVYVYIGLLSTPPYGWSILQTRMLPSWLGWASIGWSGAWLALFMVLGDNLPLVLFLPPVVIGIVMLALG
jgi:hypothetical protein